MKVLQHVGTSDHFPIFSEVCNHGIHMYKSLLEKLPLRFNSSLLLQPHFDSLMEQILVNFGRGRHEFYDVVGCTVHDLHRQELDADFTEDEVDKVLRHLPSGKSLGWDGLTNEVFKRYQTF